MGLTRAGWQTCANCRHSRHAHDATGSGQCTRLIHTTPQADDDQPTAPMVVRCPCPAFTLERTP